MQPITSELETLVRAIRTAVRRGDGWSGTADLVAEQLELHLPTPDMLTADQRCGDPDGYRSHLLHAERDGSFSIVALTWLPGQETPVHDHVTWCVFGVIQGVEYEELYTVDAERGGLVPAGTSVGHTGEVSGFAPPGDVHRVRNIGDRTAISIHVYGTDVSRIGSSVRRVYDLPVLEPAPLSARPAASLRR